MSLSKITSIILYIMMAVTIVVVGMFYAGGSVDPEAEMLTPIHTDLLLNWMYALVGLGLVCTVIFGIYHFALSLRDTPKKAIGQVVVLVVFALVLFGCWTLGNGTPLNMPGYEGTDNVYFWLKLTDTYLYTIYLMLAVSIVAIIVPGVVRAIKK